MAKFSFFLTKKSGGFKKRILVAILLLSLLVIVITTMTINKVYSNQIIKEITNTFSQISHNTGRHISLIKNEATYLLLDLNSSPLIISYLNSKDFDPLIEYDVFKRLTSFKNIYPIIHSISLYNGNIDRIISTNLPPGSTSEYFDENIIEVFESNLENRIIVVPRKQAPTNSEINSSWNTPSENLVTFILPNPKDKNSNNPLHLQSAIILNVKESEFHLELEQSINQRMSSFVLDKNGIVISHSNKDEILSDYTDKEFVIDIMKNNALSSTNTYTLDQEEYIYSYSTIINPEWKIINIVPLNDVITSANKTQYKIIIISFLIILISILVSIFISDYVYRPMSKLVNTISENELSAKYSSRQNEIDYLSQSYNNVFKQATVLQMQNQDNLNLLKNEFLKSLLIEEMNPAYVRKQIESYKIKLNENGFHLALIEIDNHFLLKEEYIEFNHEAGIQEIMMKIFNNNALYILFPVSYREFAILINDKFSNDDCFNDFKERLRKMNEVINRVFHYTFTVAFSPEVNEIKGIAGIYAQAKKLLKYKLLLGFGHIISPEMVSKYKNSLDESFEDLEIDIVKSIKVNNKTQFTEKIEELINNASKYAVDIFISKIVEVGVACAKSVEKAFEDISVQFEYDLYKSFDQLFMGKVESIEEIKSWFSSLFEHNQTFLENIKDLKSDESNYQHFIDKAKSYITENYMSNEISVESVAEHVGFSTNYFSQLFKQMTNTKLTHYISEVRFNAAKKLLTETNLTISEIAQKSGFVNTNYFYYAFKKKFGMTPDNFRFVSNM